MSVQLEKEKKLKFLAQFAFLILSLLFIGINIFLSGLTWKYTFVFEKYSVYMDWRQTISKPIFMTSVLLGIMIVLIIVTLKFFRYLRNETIKNEIVLKLFNKINSFAFGLSYILVFINTIILSIYILWHYDILSPYQYQSFSSDIVREIAIHESGHCLVNEVEFPNTTKEIRIFDKNDLSEVDIYLGSQLVKNIPGGLHRANIDLYSKQDLYKRIKVSLAGLATEELLSPKGEALIGASGDLKNVEDAVIMLVNNGLSSLGPVQWDVLSPEQKQKVYLEIVSPLNQTTKEIIINNKDNILKLANELEKKKAIKGPEALEILGKVNNSIK